MNRFIDSKVVTELELTYEINAGIPFRWEYEILDNSVVEFVRSYVLKDENEERLITGGPVYTNYVFKGLKEGSTTITFKLVSITNECKPEIVIHNIKVDKDLNIFIER